jgi:hypothetical protein
VKGSDLYVARRYAEALEALKGSFDLVRSPNSGLLIARCLREVGRLVEAAEMFSSVEADARRRVTEGEPKYARTAESASTEGADVRAGLGTIRVHVEGADAGTRLEVDGTPTTIPTDGNVLVWHLPGEATFAVRPASGLEQKQSVTVRAQSEVKMDFTLVEPPSTPPVLSAGVGNPRKEPLPAILPPPPPEHPRPTDDVPTGSTWMRSATWVSGAVAVVGAGMFAGFGLVSKDEYNDLYAGCHAGQGCQSSEVVPGKRNEAIANVSLAVASVATAATITFALLGMTSGSSKTRSSAPLTLHVGLAGLAVGGQFE